MTPSCVAASPTPSASSIMRPMRATSSASASSKRRHLGRPGAQRRIAEGPHVRERRATARLDLGIELRSLLELSSALERLLGALADAVSAPLGAVLSARAESSNGLRERSGRLRRY